jgi:hypothetical protein
MKVGGNDEYKKIFLRPEKEFLEVTMKYGGFIAFIRHDSAEIWGFRYKLTHGICLI